jgi:hypothetical protein
MLSVTYKPLLMCIGLGSKMSLYYINFARFLRLTMICTGRLNQSVIYKTSLSFILKVPDYHRQSGKTLQVEAITS